MHNLFKIRGQKKKKKDDVEGQISAWTLKHVINIKALFFVVIHMNYYFLFTYKLSNKQIKQAGCTSKLLRQAWVIKLFFMDIVTFQLCTGWIFQARAQPELKIKILAQPEWEVTISAWAHNKIKNVGPNLARPIFFFRFQPGPLRFKWF